MAARKKRKKAAARKPARATGAAARSAAEKRSKFVWRQPAADAALLLAEGELTDREITAKVGVGERQIYVWKDHPEFMARVKKHVEELGECALRYAIGRKARRLRRLNGTWEGLQQIIAERAVAREMQAAPGGKTGLLAREQKMIGSGVNAVQVTEFSVDTGLLAELRACEKQAAQELGQLVEKMALTNPDGTEEYDAGDFTADEVLAILQGIVARLGLADPGPDQSGEEVPAGQLPPAP